VFAIANVIFSQNSPFRISFSRSASPYGNIDHNRLTYTLRPHQPQPPRLHSTATSTTTAPLHPTATLTTARNFAQQSRLNSSAENFSYFFKKALDKYPKTVYNVYCYLGVAQIGSALPWGGRGRRFKSCHSDQMTASQKRSGSLFYWRYMAYGVALRVRSRSFDFLQTFVVGNEYPYNFRAFLKFF
jgi:hypothetical protein